MSGKDQGTVGRSEEDTEDVRLMQLVGRGDTGAFEELIERHQSLVAGTVARMLGSNSDVEDIAQQVFIRVWKSARRYVPRAKFTTWLLKITRNLVFNELRRSKRHAFIQLQSDPGAEEFPLKDEKNPPPDASLWRPNSSKRSRTQSCNFRRASVWPSFCGAMNSLVMRKSQRSSIYRCPR